MLKVFELLPQHPDFTEAQMQEIRDADIDLNTIHWKNVTGVYLLAVTPRHIFVKVDFDKDISWHRDFVRVLLNNYTSYRTTASGNIMQVGTVVFN